MFKILRKRLKLILLLSIPLYFSSCASTREITIEAQELVRSQVEKLKRDPLCCSEFSQMRFRPITGDIEEVLVEPGSAFSFEEGKSYFVALELAANSSKNLFLVKSQQVIWRRHGLPYIFSPSVLALDENMNITGKWIDIPLCFSQGWSQLETGYFSVLKIDPSIHRKIVIFTSERALTDSTHYGNQATTAGGGIISTIKVSYNFPHSPVGELVVGHVPNKLEDYLRNRCESSFLDPERG